MLPMIWPPSPGVTSEITNIARRASWTPVDGEYGKIEGYELTVVRGDAREAVDWHCAPALPDRCGRRFISRAAYDALRAGELTTDGTLVHEGRRYRLTDVHTPRGYVAELTPADA